ncbi:MAG: nucleoside monophosphate kinase [Patescibacteria group bacterium]
MKMSNMLKKPFEVVLLGRSGCGKGEQVKRLTKKLKNTLVIHTGDRLRSLALQKTMTGKRIRGVLARGELVPGWLASYTWLDTLIRELGDSKHILFDGTPRQTSEAEYLDEVLHWYGRKNLFVLYIDVSEKEVTRRLLLRGRGDDHKDAIKRRLAFFSKQVLPAVKYYQKTNRLIRINGEQPIEKVFKDVQKALGV